jgi:hypothetical protein
MTGTITIIVFIVTIGVLWSKVRETRAQLRQAKRDSEQQRAAFAFALRELGGDPGQVPQLAPPAAEPGLLWRVAAMAAAVVIRSLTERDR